MQDRALRLNAEQRDNLVAYLDGELEEDTTQYIDQVLAKSEVARHEVEALARTWELLDLLPKPNATENFTERTLTTLKVSETRTNLTDQPWFTYVRKGAIAVVWVAVLSVAASIGFIATTKWIPNPHDELLTDLRLMKNLDLYLEADSMSFVGELQRMGSFSPPADTKPARALDAGIIAPAPGESLKASLYDTATKLTVSERELVNRNRELWKKLPIDRQLAIRALHKDLEAAPTATRTTLETYYTWLQTLTLGQRDDLQTAKDNPERIALVLKYKSAQDAERETQQFELNVDLKRMKPEVRPSLLTPADLTAIMKLLYDRLSTPARFRVDNGEPLLVEKYARIIEQAAEQQGGLAKFPDDETIELLAEAVSEDVRRRMTKDGGAGKKFVLRMTLSSALNAMVSQELEKFYPTADQLREVFVKQSAAERQELTQLSSRELTWRLLMKHFQSYTQDSEFSRLWRVKTEELPKLFFAGGPRRPGEGGGFFPRGPRSPDGRPEGRDDPSRGPRPPEGRDEPPREPGPPKN